MMKPALLRFALPGFIVFTLLFSRCDKITDAREMAPNDTLIDDTAVVRKVLVEDYTGHTCGNCPRAAEKLDELRGIYGTRIVSMGVHVGTFAKPCPSLTCPPDAPANSYKTDFRSAAGNDFNTQFANDEAGLPNGMINRKVKNSKVNIPYADWAGMISELLASGPDAGIRIVNSYNNQSRKLTADVECRFINALGGSYKLTVLLTEDSIVDWQHDYKKNPQNIADYLHRHVLRGAINSSWGDAVDNTPGTRTAKTYNYTLNSAWNDRHCHVVAFVYNTTTFEVVQAEERPVR